MNEIKILESLIEQANAQGFFKKLDQLDIARNALNVIKNKLQEPPKEVKKDD